MTHYIEDLQPGMSATIGKTITDADIVLFAGVSTDTNAVHLDEEFGKTTAFGGRRIVDWLSGEQLPRIC